MNRSALEKFVSFSMQPTTNAPFSFRFSIWMNSKLPFIPIEMQLITQSILIKNGNKIKSPPPSGVSVCGIYKTQKGAFISVVVRPLKLCFIQCFSTNQVEWCWSWMWNVVTLYAFITQGLLYSLCFLWFYVLHKKKKTDKLFTYGCSEHLFCCG